MSYELKGQMIEVREDDDFEKALRRFKRMYKKEGIKRAHERHEFFVRPSERRRQKHFLHLERVRKWKARRERCMISII